MATKKKTSFKIPGITFSWKKLLGITKLKRKIAKTTGIPTTKEGRKRKFSQKFSLGRFIK